MSGDRLQTVALWLLITTASVFLLERLFVVVSFFATPLLLFGLAWLISLVLQPLVMHLTQLTVPIPPIPVSRLKRLTPSPWHIKRGEAVLFVYLALLAIIVVMSVAVVPAIAPQLTSLANTMPTSVTSLSEWLTSIESELRRLGFRGDLSSVIQPEALAQQAASIGSTAIQQSLGIAGSIATLLFDTFIVLILSYYITLDGPRIAERILHVLPSGWRTETETFFSIVNQTFGGFLRAQLVQSLIYGLTTVVVMGLFGLTDIALASLLSAILITIPLIGGLFAIIPPLLLTLIEASDRFLPMLIVLFIGQQVLFNVIMPRLLGRVVGLHPLLVFAALLVGGVVAGGWGVLFGIPVAGVLASVSHFLYLRANRSLVEPSG